MPRKETAFTELEKYIHGILEEESTQNLRAVAHDMGLCAGAKTKYMLAYDMVTGNYPTLKKSSTECDTTKPRRQPFNTDLPHTPCPPIRLSSCVVTDTNKRNKEAQERIRRGLKILQVASDSEPQPDQIAIAEQYLAALKKRKYFDEAQHQPESSKRPRLAPESECLNGPFLRPASSYRYAPSKPVSDERPATLFTTQHLDSISGSPSSSPTADSPCPQKIENNQLPPIRKALHFFDWSKPLDPLDRYKMTQDRQKYISFR